MLTIVNHSTLITNADVQTMTRAVASQLWYQAAPLWKRSPLPVAYASTESDAQPGSWVMVVLDDSDQAGALGYHDETAGEVIYGRVFVRPVLDNGGDALHKPLSVASVLSHEALEIMGDPNVNLWADTGTGTSIAVELGDPVESYSYPIHVRGVGAVTVSDFVGPAWFDPLAKAGDRFDWLGKCTAPFQVAPGGYVITMTNGQVSQKFGETYPAWRKEMKRTPLARTARRIRPAIAPLELESESDSPSQSGGLLSKVRDHIVGTS